MSVRNGFTIEIYGFTHSLHTSLGHVPSLQIMEDSEERRQRQSRERVQSDGRRDENNSTSSKPSTRS